MQGDKACLAALAGKALAPYPTGRLAARVKKGEPEVSIPGYRLGERLSFGARAVCDEEARAALPGYACQKTGEKGRLRIGQLCLHTGSAKPGCRNET